MKSRNALIPGLGAALVIALASCWRPAFDLAISDSERLAKRLERVSGFATSEYWESSSSSGYFVPHKSLAPTDGYWVVAGDSGLYARFIAFSSGTAYCFSSSSFSNSLGAAASIGAMTEPAASSLSPAFYRGFILAAYAESVRAVGADAYGALTLSTSVSVSGSNLSLIGAYLGPWTTSIDRQALLYRDTSAGSLCGTSFSVDHETAFVDPVPTLVTPTTYYDLDIGSGAFFGQSPSGYYYLSGIRKSDGSLFSLRWNGLSDAAPLILSGVTRQLTAILSDGRLIARNDSSTIVYSAEGAELFEMRTGSLRFVHELYDSGAGAWYSYFTRSVVINPNGDSSSRSLKVDVYRIPTANLKELS